MNKICIDCGQDKEHYSLGLCRNCYRRKRYQNPKVKEKQRQYMDKYLSTEKGKTTTARAKHRYYSNNKEKHQEYMREYRKDSEYWFKKRYRDDVYSRREEILTKLGKVCSLCGSVDSLEIHHKEYTTDLKDLQVLCKSCHRKEHYKE